MTDPDVRRVAPQSVRREARESLGHDLTPVQQRAVGSVLAGRDTLLVSPTGSGKSAVYQLAGSLLEGLSVVVSPLLALQEDQLAGLTEADLGVAVVLSSLRGARAHAAALARIAAGEVDFVLLGPEQMLRDDVVATLRDARIDRLVVDEAHCIDSWGADFRPDFALLGAIRAEIGGPPALALTATAAPPVRAAIADVLGMVDPKVIVTDAERTNLDIEIQRHAAASAARDAVLEAAVAADGSALVYVGTRRQAEELAASIDAAGRRSVAYHGSLPARSRAAVHEAFRSSDPPVVVATNAFGLGIDAPHVRTVIHLDPPETIDAYYQEIGRAGRDGDPARAVLHTALAEPGSRRFASGRSMPTLAGLAAIAGITRETRLDELRLALREPRGRFLQSLRLLARVGVIEYDRHTVRPGQRSYPDVIGELDATIAEQAALVTTRRRMVDALLESTSCRWATIAGYLAVPTVSTCGHCDMCRAEGAPRSRSTGLAMLEHPEFGEGQVVQRDGDVLTVLFSSHGYRTLSATLLEELGVVPAPSSG